MNERYLIPLLESTVEVRQELATHWRVASQLRLPTCTTVFATHLPYRGVLGWNRRHLKLLRRRIGVANDHGDSESGFDCELSAGCKWKTARRSRPCGGQEQDIAAHHGTGSILVLWQRLRRGHMSGIWWQLGWPIDCVPAAYALPPPPNLYTDALVIAPRLVVPVQIESTQMCPVTAGNRKAKKWGE